MDTLDNGKFDHLNRHAFRQQIIIVSIFALQIVDEVMAREQEEPKYSADMKALKFSKVHFGMFYGACRYSDYLSLKTKIFFHRISESNSKRCSRSGVILASSCL